MVPSNGGVHGDLGGALRSDGIERDRHRTRFGESADMGAAAPSPLAPLAHNTRTGGRLAPSVASYYEYWEYVDRQNLPDVQLRPDSWCCRRRQHTGVSDV